MECSEAARLIDASLDGELDLTAQLALDAHLAGCAACRAAHAGRQALIRRVRTNAESFPMPLDLRRRLLATVPDAAAPSPPGRRQGWLRWPRTMRGPWAATGGLSLASAALAVALIVVLPGRGDAVVHDLVAAHVRSLMAEHLTDVASTDRHTVKPWFNGRVDVSPPVPDLAEQGFPLTGGRLDYVAGRPVAVLVYRRARHVINLFAWPEPAALPDMPRQLERNGFLLLHWRSPGLSVWAVSDLNRGELEEFQRLWAQASASAP